MKVLSKAFYHVQGECTREEARRDCLRRSLEGRLQIKQRPCACGAEVFAFFHLGERVRHVPKRKNPDFRRGLCLICARDEITSGISQMPPMISVRALYPKPSFRCAEPGISICTLLRSNSHRCQIKMPSGLCPEGICARDEILNSLNYNSL